MTRWEYLLVYLRENHIDELNRYGAIGWECFFVDAPTSLFWLKRPLQSAEYLAKTPRKESKK